MQVSRSKSSSRTWIGLKKVKPSRKVKHTHTHPNSHTDITNGNMKPLAYTDRVTHLPKRRRKHPPIYTWNQREEKKNTHTEKTSQRRVKNKFGNLTSACSSSRPGSCAIPGDITKTVQVTTVGGFWRCIRNVTHTHYLATDLHTYEIISQHVQVGSVIQKCTPSKKKFSRRSLSLSLLVVKNNKL